MTHNLEQILRVAQMQAAEQALIDAGSSVDRLMQIAGRGAADWVWRLAGRHRVTVLCGPGNNGGDGYVIAEAIRERGGEVSVICAIDPRTDAARNARRLFGGTIDGADADLGGEIMVDCLFGSGLSRPLAKDHVTLLNRLAGQHRMRIAIDLPSGVESNTGMMLNEDLPDYELTIALGAWKFAHFLMPASRKMGTLRLVDIGVTAVPGAARRIVRPHIDAPPADSHKYRRGLLSVIGGRMPGAALLACEAAQRAGAGYVKLFADDAARAPHDLVVVAGRLCDVLADDRSAAILVGPGLGRDASSRGRLDIALAQPVPMVLDADALLLLDPQRLGQRAASVVATPHEGELAALERAFGLDGAGSKAERAAALAQASEMVIVAKGPDTVVAAPDGGIACAGQSTSWLSTAGTGDVLAGVIASRLATGLGAFEAACQGVWFQAEAARLCPPGFTAGDLARAIPAALTGCL